MPNFKGLEAMTSEENDAFENLLTAKIKFLAITQSYDSTWTEISYRRPRKNYLIGYFHIEWTLDQGWVALYIEPPTSRGDYWRLRIKFPREGKYWRSERITIIQAPQLFGILYYLACVQIDIELDFEILNALKKLPPMASVPSRLISDVVSAK
jgi:hypothetical protein